MAGSVLDGDRRQLCVSLRQLMFKSRPTLSMHGRLLVRHVLGQTIANAAKHVGIDRRPDVTAALVEWQTCDVSSERLFANVNRLVASFAAAIEDAATEPRGVEAPDPRVRQLLDAVAIRYGEPCLSLKSIVAEAHLSVWHATKLVKRHTGVSFSAHLHRVRVAAARNLLRWTALSVKEIATTVGYNTSTQLDRHFKRLSGTNPVTFRYRSLRRSRQRQDSMINNKN